MSLLGRHLTLAVTPTPDSGLTDREAFLLGALLAHEVGVAIDRYGGWDLVDPLAVDDIRDRLRDRWIARLHDGGGDEGERLRKLGRGER